MTPSPGGSRPDPASAPADTLVDAGDVRLQATVHAAPGLPAGAPLVVAVHGYPDTRRVWDHVVTALARDHRVVTYDVRGAGASDAPAAAGGYRTERLVDDLVAVLDTLAPGRRRVHLLGHDWGSVQLWDAVCAEETDPRLLGRIASFTSVGGPSLDHVAAFLRWAPPAEVRAQRRRSRYVVALLVPVVPELVWRHLTGPARRRLVRVGRLAAVEGPAGHWADTLGEDGARGLGLYRANLRRRLRCPGPGRTRVPVQLVVPRLDPFLTPAVLAYGADGQPDLERVDVDGGHWLPRTHPTLLADLVRALVARTDASDTAGR